MSILSVNDVFQSAENEHLYRILWISDDAESVYVFDMDTLDMPVVMTMRELRDMNNGTESNHFTDSKMIAED
jgi:TusA-related sulfurtransferase